MQNEAGSVASVTKTQEGRTLNHMDTSEPVPPPDPAVDWSAADRRRMPAHLKRKHRKRPAPKPAVTEKVVDEQRQPLTECARCGTQLPASASTGRPRIYCSAACRKAAYEDRRAKREGAVKVQLVDRVVVQTVERVERVQHPPAECVTMVLADPALTRKVLIGLSRQVGSKRITPVDDAFWDLVTSVEFLSEAFARATNRST
jgi:hypothetical protein